MPKTKFKGPPPPIGVNFGKRDMERVGFFGETSWMHGVPYISPHNHEFREGANQGRQLLSQVPKIKVGLQDCYFEKGPYKRIFEGEAWSSSVREGFQATLAASQKNLSSSPFMAGAPGKKSSTPGDFYGTFTGRIEALSGLLKARSPYVREPPNVITSPGKKGTYGFTGITINPFPVHMPDDFWSSLKNRRAFSDKGKSLIRNGPLISTFHPRPCFNANPWFTATPASCYVKRPSRTPSFKGPVWVPTNPPKKQGNNHAGCFSKYPEYKSDSNNLLRRPRESNVFFPQIHNKTKYTSSVVDHNVSFRVNAKNWRTFKPFTFKFNPLTDGPQ